jgi:hypothetical protein
MMCNSRIMSDKFNWLTVKLLLALASTVILGSKSQGTHDHILFSDGWVSLQTHVNNAFT